MVISDEYTLLKIIRNTLTHDNGDDVLLSGNDFDDCALIKIDDENSMAVTSDFVRGSGFLPFKMGYMSYYDVGWYLIGANLSDLASCGATPSGLTTAIRYSPEMSDDDFKEVFKGMNDICDKYNVSIVGGDTGSYVSDVFCATAFGKIETGKALLRRNVRDNHVVCVTGNLGNPVAAMLYLKNNLHTQDILTKQEEDSIFSSWRRVTPRIEEGKILSKNFENIAAQDISDGFKATLLQMGGISGKNFMIYEDLLPIQDEVKKIATALEMDYLKLAFSASVDFELLITMTIDDFKLASKEFLSRGLSLIKIGEVTQESRTLITRSGGDVTEIPGVEWKQQQGDFMNEISN